MRIIKNFFYNIGYQVLIIIVPLILAPYISRVVGPDGVGTYSYTYSIVMLFGLFANLGIAKYGNREISKCGESRELRTQVFSELFSVKIVTSIVVLMVYLCFIKISGEPYTIAFYVQIFNLLSFMLDISWFFWGMQEFRITTAICAVYNVLSIFIIFAFVKTDQDIYVYIFILAFRAFLIQLTPWLFVHRYVDVRLLWKDAFRKHWKSLLLLFFPVFAKYLYNMMDRIMIGNMVGIREVGYYENVQSIVITAVTVLTATGDVVMPRMTRMYVEGETEKAASLFRGTFHLISYISVGIMFGFIAVAAEFIPWFYGNQFISCIHLLQMIAPVVLFSGYADLIRNVFLLPHYMDKEYVVALISGAVINFIINFSLIRPYGSAGAIIGTVCAEFLVMIMQFWFVRNEVKIGYFLRQTIVYCVMGGMILIVCKLVNLSVENPLINIVLDVLVGGGIYTTLVYLYLRFVERKTFDIWQEIRIE